MYSKRIEQCKEIDQLFVNGAKCVVLGKGKTSRAVTDYIRQNTSVNEFEYIVDDQYATTVKESLSFFLNNSMNNEVFIVFGISDRDRADEIAQMYLIPGGYRYFFFSLPFSFNETRTYINEDYYNQYCDQFRKIRELLDEHSKRLFDEYITAQISGDEAKLEKYSEDTSEQYFCDKYLPESETTFIDVGAYTGDTVMNAVGKINIIKYFALEPDHNNCNDLKKLINNTEIPFEVIVIESGAYSETTELRFDTAGSSSQISEKGDERISVIELDSLIDKIDPAKELFIKMDVEGEEKNALSGAQRLIRERRPYLAICVYHCADDLIKIPQIIEEIRRDTDGKYRYGLRYYGNNFRELVLYAVPCK